MSKAPADSGSGAGNRLLGTRASTPKGEAGKKYGRGTQAGVETQVERGNGAKEASPPSLAFLAVLILVLDLMGVFQSSSPGNGDGSTQFQLGYTVVHDANVVAAALSALVVVMVFFEGTSPCAGPSFKSLILLLASSITVLALVSSVVFTWLQQPRPLFHMSFVGAVVLVAISASYYCRP